MRAGAVAGVNDQGRHDPGGRVARGLAAGVLGQAEFSHCGRYRSFLSRDWSVAGSAPRAILFVGQNPSVANAELSDPTIAKETGYAMRWGYSRYLKGNILDWRATHPADLPRDPGLARSEGNLGAVLAMAAEAEMIVLAWGNMHPRFDGIVGETLEALAALERPMRCFAINRNGSPRHPLYCRGEAELIPYR